MVRDLRFFSVKLTWDVADVVVEGGMDGLPWITIRIDVDLRRIERIFDHFRSVAWLEFSEFLGRSGRLAWPRRIRP